MNHLLDNFAHIYVLILYDSLNTCLYPYGSCRGGEINIFCLIYFSYFFQQLKYFKECIICVHFQNCAIKTGCELMSTHPSIQET